MKGSGSGRGRAAADAGDVVARSPLAAFAVDQEERLVAWNAVATELFGLYTPEEIGRLKKRPADVELRAELLSLAATLDAYNNGELGLGPGHCSE